MKLEVFLVPPEARGFAELLLERSLDGAAGPRIKDVADYSGVCYVTPTNSLAESRRRAFHRLAGPCYLPPQITTLRRLSSGLYRTYGDRPVLPEELAPVLISALAGGAMGFAGVIAGIARDLKRRFPGQTQASLRELLSGVFAELALPEDVAQRATSALGLVEKYEAAVGQAGYVDGDDAFWATAGIIDRHFRADTLFLDGFYEITRAEELVIGALIEKAERAFAVIPVSRRGDDLSHCYSNFLMERFKVEPAFAEDGTGTPGAAEGENGPPATHYHPFGSFEEEVEAIARHIKGSFISGRLKDLEDAWVVFPSLHPYGDMVERVFDRYGIPHSAPAGKTLSRMRPFRDLLSLIEAVNEDYPRLKTARVLASPSFERIPPGLKAAAPGICLSSGIIKGRKAWLKAAGERGLAAEAGRFFGTCSKLNLIGNNVSYDRFLDVLLDVLKTLGFALSEEEKAEFEAVLRKLALLDDVLGRGTDLRGFTDALRSVLGATAPKAAETPGVRVAEVFEVRGLEPRMLYFGGLKDGDLPSRPEMDLLLPDSVRKRLGLVDMARYLRLQEYIFRRLVRASEAVHLSYPTMEGDKVFLPSLFLAGAEEKRQRAYGIFSPEEELLRSKAAPLEEQMGEIEGVHRLSNGPALNVTDVDYYRACPRRYFIEKALCLEAPEIREYEVEPKTVGTIAHEVMEGLIREGAGEEFDAFRQRARRLLDEALGRWPMEEYFRGLIRESFLNMLPDIYRLERGITDDGYAFRDAELRVEGEPIRGIRLKGKIDRLDARAEDRGAVQVVDYKTGAAYLAGRQVIEKGESLQLFLYAALLRGDGLKPRRVGLYSLKDLKIKYLPGRQDARKGLGLDDYVTAALMHLEDTVARMRKGDFAAAPLSEQTCRNCHERPYCPYIQGAGTRATGR
jgi:RecB family exonuclease